MYLPEFILGFIMGILLHRNKLKAFFTILLGLLILAFCLTSINPQVAVEVLADPGWIVGCLFTWFGMGCGAGASMLYNSLRGEKPLTESYSEKFYWVREDNQVKVYNDRHELVEVVPVQRDSSGNEFAATSTIGLIILKPKYERLRERGKK